MKIKTVSGKREVKAYVDLLSKSKIPFSLQVSNYTIVLNSEPAQMKFLKEERPGAFFACYSKIKANVKKFKLPIIDKDQVRYFQHDFRSNQFHKEVWNIDLKNAYATVLFNEGFIDKECYDYISAAPKDVRLPSIGMLASKKYIFNYDKNGLVENYEKVTGEYENFFFYCVKRVFEIMDVMKMICGNTFLYTWVDSVYFKPNEDVKKELIEYLESMKFRHSEKVLINMDIITREGNVQLSYEQQDDPGQVISFFIPPGTREFSESVAHYLTNIKVKR